MNMSRQIKEGLLPRLRARYPGRGRLGRSRMLDELCQNYGDDRKYAIKLLGGTLPPPHGRPKPGPAPKYAAIEPVVRRIWLAAEQPCGKRLAPALALWLPHYERHHERLNRRQRDLLRSVSAATLDRLLAPARAAQPQRGLSGTKPGSLWRTEIPVRTDNWDITQPGFLEADTVAHCGGSLAGDFIWSAIFTDNGKEFTDRFVATGERQPTGRHRFDRACRQHGIEHRLISPRRPQTNGMVERFNGRVSEILQTTRFDSAGDLQPTLERDGLVYDHQLPQRALGHRTPVQALQHWQQERPDLFPDKRHHHAGPDTY